MKKNHCAIKGFGCLASYTKSRFVSGRLVPAHNFGQQKKLLSDPG